MIDATTEQVIPLIEANRLPMLPGRNGRRISYSTLWRWAQHGVRGGVRLETLRIGGRMMTSVEAVERFISRLNGNTPTASTTKRRLREIAAAEAELDAAGIR